jgi:undecaprenyl-diphosphatase
MIWLVLGVVIALSRPRAAAGVWQMALAILIASQLTDHVLKPAVGRGRPFTAVMDVRVIAERPDTHSFPSGHAANAFAGALALGRVWWRRGRVALWLLAATIAFSRVYVGVHYPLDVLGGAIVGLASGWFVLGGRRPVAPPELALSRAS